MDQFLTYLPDSVDPGQLALVAGAFMAATLLLSSLGRTFLGEQSELTNAVSSAIGILFIYVITVVVVTVGGDLEPFQAYLSPLPFISLDNDLLQILVIPTSDTGTVCTHIISMVILAFLVNILDSAIPRGENLLSWLVWRCITVALAMLAHLWASDLIARYIPGVIAENASMILLGLLLLMLAVGSLKIPIGFAIATVNPVIAALYTFFFANVVGQQISKAVLTTALLCAFVYGLNSIGLAAIPVDPSALMGYLPFLSILAAIWYVVNQIL